MAEFLARDNDDAADAFWRDGYHVVDALLSAGQCALLKKGMDLSQRAGTMRVANNRAYQGPNNQYAPLPAQLLLGSLAPKLSTLVGRTLLPSFSFWRIYEQGAVLNRHMDRNACEVSVTISLASEPEGSNWPIGVTDLHGVDHSISLNPGAGLVYLGTQVPHWREKLANERHYQMFLHYVLADGPFATLKHDAGIALIP